MKKILLVLLILIFVTYGVFAYPLHIEDASGVTISIESKPKRIITLSPSLTKQLFELGSERDIIGVTTFCKYPAEAEKKQKIGSIIQPNIEKIVSLKPDLIFAHMEGNTKESIKKLRSLGLKVFVLGASRNLDDIFKDFILIAKILQKENKALEIIEKVKKEIKFVKNKTSNLKKVKVFWEVGSRPLITVAKDTFVDEIITLSGGLNIAHESPVRYPMYSLEKIITQNPDVIVIVDMGIVTSEEIKKWKKFKEITAVKSGRIHSINAYIVSLPTPLTFLEGVKVTSEVFYPDIFKKK